MSRQKLFTLLGLVVFLAISLIASLSAVQKLSARPFDPSLTALFPVELTRSGDPKLEAAVREKLSGEGAQSVTVILSLRDATLSSDKRLTLAIEASDRLSDLLDRSELFTPVRPSAETLEAFRPSAGQLMSDGMRLKLLETLTLPDAQHRLFQDALMNLSNPAAPKLMGFQQDPFGLFDSWLAQRQSSLGTRPVMGRSGPFSELIEDDPDTSSIVLSLTVPSGIAESGQGRLTAALDRAKAEVTDLIDRSHPQARLEIAAAGVPLFTDSIAATAQSELTMIGTISTICVLGLALLLFGHPLIVFTMALTVAVGFWTGLVGAVNTFGTLSLLTFVFGATLIGVTVDYSAHWFAGLTAPGHRYSAWLTQKNLFPSLTLAALSTAVAYGLLAITPLPGLRQMAVFAAVGVTGAYLTVMLLLPFLHYRLRRETEPTATPLMNWLTIHCPRCPRFNKERWATPSVFCITALYVVFLAGGLWQLTPGGDLRDLQGVPRELLNDQSTVSRKLALPSPAQAFLIEGQTLDEALEREEMLKDSLSAMAREKPQLKDIRPFALSDWLQSAHRSHADEMLARRAVQAIAAPMHELLGAKPLMPGRQPLSIDALKNSLAHDLVRQTLLLNEKDRTVTIFYLSGLHPEDLPYLRRLAALVPGTSFVDLTGELNTTFSLYRDRVMMLLGAGLLALFLLLRLPYGREAWRCLLPAALGILTAMAFLGWIGLPFTLFSALASVLLLGLGVDCGIFLSGAPSDGRAWTAVFFSGTTTMLSFGLLSLSSTPALGTFGLSVLVGQLTIWLIAPLVRPKQRTLKLPLNGNPSNLPPEKFLRS